MRHSFQMLEIPPLLDMVESLLVDENADETLLGEVNFYRGFMLTLFQGDADGHSIKRALKDVSSYWKEQNKKNKMSSRSHHLVRVFIGH